MTQQADLVIKNISKLLTMDPASGGVGDREASPVAGLGMILDGALAAAGERVIWVGKEKELNEQVQLTSKTQVFDVEGRAVMPGLVDCHTHLVFAGSRAQEFASRISGTSYEAILASGGGIHSTVKATRQASYEALYALAWRRLERFLSLGITTLEVKSGYGLDTENELKILRVVSGLNRNHVMDLVPTFLGAHTIPADYRHRRKAYLDLLEKEMIPAIASQQLAKFCDVFCEQEAFDLNETRRILETALDHGMQPKLHALQFSSLDSVELALELQALSVDHLEHITRKQVEKLASSKTVAVLLPGATYFLGKKDYAPGRMLVDLECPVAISTDFNPGSCMTENLQLVMNMACICNGLYPREAILGATRWAAQALGLENEVGTLLPGRLADILVLDSHDYRNLIYNFGMNHTYMVFKRGEKVNPEQTEKVRH